HTRFSRDWSSDVCSSDLTWLKPELVCEVSFTEITGDGVFRHPSFKGMRTDKDAREVLREKPVHTEDIVGSAETPDTGKKKAVSRSEERRVGKEGRYVRWV